MQRTTEFTYTNGKLASIKDPLEARAVPTATSNKTGKNKHLTSSITIDTIYIRMPSDIGKILEEMRQGPKGIRYADLCKVCDRFFGSARQSGSSHRVYKTPWLGDPRVNIQNDHGKAKAYQVRQVLKAIDRLEGEKKEEPDNVR